MAVGPKRNALDLGALQANLEAASKNLKSAVSAAKKAKEVEERAEADYASAQKALAAGMAQLLAATKVA